MEQLYNLTGAQLEELHALLKLQKDAKELYSIVMKHQKVGLGDRHELWSDAYNKEFLDRRQDGRWVWVASYLHHYYSVVIDADSIFERLKQAYLFDKKPENRRSVNSHADAMKHFRHYVHQLEAESDA